MDAMANMNNTSKPQTDAPQMVQDLARDLINLERQVLGTKSYQADGLSFTSFQDVEEFWMKAGNPSTGGFLGPFSPMILMVTQV